MKTFLVFCTLLIGLMCFASGPVMKESAAASATVSQTVDPGTPAIAPLLYVHYELPFAGTIPELGMPLQSAELTGFLSDIWHPPVNSVTWLERINKINLVAFYDPVPNLRVNSSLNTSFSEPNKSFYICWYDIA